MSELSSLGRYRGAGHTGGSRAAHSESTADLRTVDLAKHRMLSRGHPKSRPGLQTLGTVTQCPCTLQGTLRNVCVHVSVYMYVRVCVCTSDVGTSG